MMPFAIDTENLERIFNEVEEEQKVAFSRVEELSGRKESASLKEDQLIRKLWDKIKGYIRKIMIDGSDVIAQLTSVAFLK